jgi:cobalt-zinc-cadmium efflux system membrane fusion protein
MSARTVSLALVFMLSHAVNTALAEELNISPSQLDNLGVEFGAPQVADLADDFQAPARVRIPPTKDYAVVPILPGTIKKLGFSAGDTVRKGEPIAWVGSPDFLILQGEYIDAYHQLQLSKTRFSHDKTLNEEGIVSSRRLSESKHEMEDHRVAEQRLRHSLNLAGLEEAEVNALRDTLLLQPEMILRAPADGIILEEFSTAGQRIDPSQAVYRIADLSTLWLVIDVPFMKSLDLIPGGTVLVKQRQRTITAKVSNIGRHVDENNQTVVVRAVIENGSGLAPGQFLTATFTKDRSDEYLLLPAGSVVRKDNRDYVFIQKPEGVEVREIEVIRQSQGWVFVSSGIATDESVATRGTAALKARWLGIGGGD